MTFRDCDDQDLPLPEVMLSFTSADKQYRQTEKLAESIITLKPYRFASGSQNILTDIHDNRGNVLSLNLPGNSIIQESEATTHAAEFPGVRHVDTDSKPLEGVIGYLNGKSRLAQINLSVVYGLHHSNLQES